MTSNVSEWHFENEKNTLAVGIVIFKGSVDIRDILAHHPQHLHLGTIDEGRMNKNTAVLSCLFVPFKPLDGDTSRKDIASTLYAARIDVSLVKYKENKERAMLIANKVLEAWGVEFAANEKPDSKYFTLTLYKFGRAVNITELSDAISHALDNAGNIGGTVEPDFVKVHFTGCRSETELHSYSNVFTSIFAPRSVGLASIDVYIIMQNLSYNIGRNLVMSQFVQNLTTAPSLSDCAVLYDNSAKPSQVIIMWPVSANTVADDPSVRAWRTNYDVYVTIKHNGKVDQSSFATSYGVRLQNKLGQALMTMTEDAFRI